MNAAGGTGGLGLGTGTRGRFAPAALRLLLTVGALSLLLWWLPTQELWAGVRRVNARTWIALWTGFVAGHALAAFKWRRLMQATGLVVDAREALRAHGAGLFANLWLPSLVGGDVVRAGVLARADRGPAPLAVAALADRTLDAAVLVSLAALGAVSSPGSLDATAARLLAAAAVAICLGACVALAAARALDPARLPARLAGPVARLQSGFAALRSRPRDALVAATLSAAVQAGFVALNAALGAAVGIDLPLSVWFLAWPLAKLAALLPISLSGIGVREAALAALLAPFGVAPALAVAQSLVWETLLVATGLLAGAAVWWLGRGAAAGGHAA